MKAKVGGPTIKGLQDQLGNLRRTATILAIPTAAVLAYSSPTFHGAKGDGVTNDRVAINSSIADNGIKILKNGDYFISGAINAFPHPTLILADNAKESGTYLPFVTVTQPTNNFKNIPQVHAFFLQNTTYRDDERVVDIRRWVNTNDGKTNPHALHVETIKYDSNAQTEWAIAGVIYSYNTTADNGSTAVSGTSFKMVDGGAGLFASHFQARDEFKAATSSTVTGTIGTETNVMAVGDDHPTVNQIGTSGRYAGARWGQVYIPITNTSVSGWNTATGNYGEVVGGAAIHIHNDIPSRSNGTWRTGIVIRDISGNTNPIDHAIHINTNGGRSILMSGNVTGTHLQVTGNGTNGLILSGTYSGLAMRINTGEKFGWNSTGTITQSYNTVANILGFFDTSTERFGVDMTASPNIRIAGTKVLGARDTGWAADTGTASKASHATYSGTASAGYVQAEMQAVMDAVRDVTQSMKAMKDMGINHGYMGT